jgi:predicted transcriptional regulator
MSEGLKKSKALLAARGKMGLAKSFFSRTATAEQTKPVQNKKGTIKPAKPADYENETVEMPRESKLMVCLNILCSLVSTGPLTVIQLKTILKTDETRLKPLLKLLWDRGFVEEDAIDEKESRYTVTERGTKILKVISPIVKEAHKMRIRDLEMLSSALLTAGYQ